MEALKFSIIIIFLSILIFLMGLFITKSISHSIFLIYFILSFLLPMLIIYSNGIILMIKKITLSLRSDLNVN